MPTSNERLRATVGDPVPEARDSLYLAIVCAIDGARFVAVAENEPQCVARVAAYVKEQAPEQLSPPSVGRIHELFAAGDVTGAVAEYFRRSGERWDAEWLVTTCLRADPRSAVWSGTVPFPKARRDSHQPPPSGQGAAAVMLAHGEDELPEALIRRDDPAGQCRFLG